MTPNKCLDKTIALSYDEACLDVLSSSSDVLAVNGQYAECYLCDTKNLENVTANGNTSILIDTKYEFLVNYIGPDGYQYCNTYYQYEEHGIYGWNISSGSCSAIYIKEAPDNPYLPILGAFIVFLLFGTFWYGVKCIYRSTCTSNIRSRLAHFTELETDLGSPEASPSTVIPQPQPAIHKRPGSGRIKSLDVFRGLTIMLMIFINYGGGQYSFFKHSIWNGLTVADLVFPWFAWIMGLSIALSVRSSLRAGVSRPRLIWRAFVRCCLLVLIGIALNTVSSNRFERINSVQSDGSQTNLDQWGTEFLKVRETVSVEDLRIPGVLQRLGLAGFVVAVLEILFMKTHSHVETNRWYIFSDIIQSLRQWIVVLVLVIIHTCITFLMKVPGCPTGYLWPGGLHHHGEYENCTGGAAGYIDRLVFGPNHLYKTPSFMKMYDTNVPYDPEGLLGTLTTVLCVYLGVQAGRILLTYNNPKSRVIRWAAWGIVTGIISGYMCAFSKNHGHIPINKNLWSLSYVLATSSLAFIIQTIIFLMVDVSKRWGGRPLFYPGMNSLFIYIGHILTKNMFPWAWTPSYYTHREFMVMNLWGTFLWVAIAVFLYKKRIILKL